MKKLSKSLASLSGAIYKELLDEMDLLCKRTKASNRDRILMNGLPTLVWQIIKQPNPYAKIA